MRNEALAHLPFNFYQCTRSPLFVSVTTEESTMSQALWTTLLCTIPLRWISLEMSNSHRHHHPTSMSTTNQVRKFGPRCRCHGKMWVMVVGAQITTTAAEIWITAVAAVEKTTTALAMNCPRQPVTASTASPWAQQCLVLIPFQAVRIIRYVLSPWTQILESLLTV